MAALASWLDARAHGGCWRVRIEDVDTPRCVPGADHEILRQLGACGLQPDGEVVWQSHRGARYQQALDAVIRQGLAYPCTCSRKTIAQALARQGGVRERHGEWVYPGTCRPPAAVAAQTPRLAPPRMQTAQTADSADRSSAQVPPCGHPVAGPTAAWRLRVAAPCPVHWTDRRLGPQMQDVATGVGDFVLRRADGLWAYQLAVVMDDAAQGVTHVVRGEDLADNTARQIVLQRALGLTTPQYLHTPLVRAASGEKLSKQTGASPLLLHDAAAVMAALNAAAAVLGLPAQHGLPADALSVWVACWAATWRVA